MKPFISLLVRVAFAIVALAVVLVAVVWWRYGGGTANFPDRTGKPALPGDVLETVALLPLPPGNIAVSRTGRVFFSFHPEGRPTIKVAELIKGKAMPYPTRPFQTPADKLPHFRSVLSLRIDRQERLWTLDHGDHGTRQARIVAFDLRDNRVTHHYDFPDDVAPLGSHFNDFQVDARGRFVFIADASIFGLSPALVVYDAAKRRARRLLNGHPAVAAGSAVPRVQGVVMKIFGIFAIKPGVDSIALARDGKQLYFGAVTARHMYQVRVADLLNPLIGADERAPTVERFTEKTVSDGLSSDVHGNLYVTDPEHSAIVMITPGGRLRTLIKDPRLRWPDGLSFGPNGYLYVTCSALQHVIMKGAKHVAAHAPYHIYRFRPGGRGVAGH